jgi:FkbM family methyltransferase
MVGLEFDGTALAETFVSLRFEFDGSALSAAIVAALHRLPIPIRAIANVVRSDWRRRYLHGRQPDTVTLQGIELKLDRPWVTPTIRKAIYDGWYESEQTEILAKTLRPDDRYLEVGAGIGFVATAACQRVGSASVVAFEANPALLDAIDETAARNGCALNVVNAVLGEDDGWSDFYVDDDFWGSSLTPIPGAPVIQVPRKSLHEEIARHRASYLMVDIEGGEIELLGASEPIPGEVRAICLELHPRTTGDESIREMLVKLMSQGFTPDLKLSRDDVMFLSR